MFPFLNFEHPPPRILQVAQSCCLPAEVPLRALSGAPDAPGIGLDLVSQQCSVLMEPAFWGRDGHQTSPASTEGKCRAHNESREGRREWGGQAALGNWFLGYTKRSAMSRAREGGLLLSSPCPGPAGAGFSVLGFSCPLVMAEAKGRGPEGGARDGGGRGAHIPPVTVRTTLTPEGRFWAEHFTCPSCILSLRSILLPLSPFYGGANGGLAPWSDPDSGVSCRRGKAGAWVSWTPEVMLMMS